MTDQWFIGIDFGTTNCSIAFLLNHPAHRRSAILQPEVCKAELPDGRKVDRFPSVLSRPIEPATEKGHAAHSFGWTVKDHFLRCLSDGRGLRLVRNRIDILAAVKNDLGTAMTYPRAFHATLRSPVDCSAIILRELMAILRRSQPGFRPEAAWFVITVPSSSSEEARRETLDAASRAGIPRERARLIDEPVAAVTDVMFNQRSAQIFSSYQRRSILAFNYGGGTCDASLLTGRYLPRSGGMPEILGSPISSSSSLGGDLVDQAIYDAFVKPRLGSDRGQLGPNVIRAMRDTLVPLVARELKERLSAKIWERLGNHAIDNDATWSEIRRENPFVEIDLPEALELDRVVLALPRSVDLSFRDLKAAMSVFLARDRSSRPRQLDLFDIFDYPDGGPRVRDTSRSLIRPVLEVLRKSNADPATIFAVVATGSGCKDPLVRRFLTRAFASGGDLGSRAKVVDSVDLDSSVARGAAVACYAHQVRGVPLGFAVDRNAFAV